MRWMISLRFVFLSISVALSALVAVCLANNCYLALTSDPMYETVQDLIELNDDNLVFPFDIPGTALTALSLVCYEGTFLEDGGDLEVTEITALMLRNNGDKHIINASVELVQGGNILVFELTHVPVHGEILVLERKKQPYLRIPISECRADVHTEDYNGWDDALLLTVAGKQELIADNLTERELKNVIVYYKTYYAPGGFYVGGITHSIQMESLDQGEEARLFPHPYISDSSAVVWAAFDG